MVTTGQFHRFRALIVDDDELVRRILCRAFSEGGFESNTASDGEHAFEMLSNFGGYDLLVTDLHMPKCSGHALSLDALRDHPNLVVMVHTAVEEPRLIEDLISSGVDDVVLKPTNYRVLAAKARGLVARRRGSTVSTDRHDQFIARGSRPNRMEPFGDRVRIG